MILRESSNTFLVSPKFFALSALILAFPPVFTSFSKADGLKVSLALVLLYLIRGLVTLASAGRPKLRPFFQFGRIFHFAEIPLVLAAAYMGLRWIPGWSVLPYEQALLLSTPINVLLEGFASMVIILSLGETLSDILSETTTAVKIFAAAACAMAYGCSGLVIYSLYYGSQINTVASASLVAAVITLLLVLTVASVVVEYGTLTDPAMITLYITYNIWTISRSSHQLTFRPDAKNIYSYLSEAIWNLVPSDSVSSMIGSALNMFSIEIIASLLFQMSVFVVSSRHLLPPKDQWTTWFYSVFWPCFGKSTVILVYTYAWLMYGRQASFPFWMDPTFWRWINVAMCLAIYSRHLIIPPNNYEIY